MSLTPAERLMNKKVTEFLEEASAFNEGFVGPLSRKVVSDELACAKVARELGVEPATVERAWSKRDA